MTAPRENMDQRIEHKIREALNPEYLEVINESHRHAGHAGDDGSGASHYKLIIVCTEFSGLSRIVMQQKIYEILRDEMKQIHALSLDLKAK